jgi:Ankyrin repeats (3 copies)/Ankyrin repeat
MRLLLNHRQTAYARCCCTGRMRRLIVILIVLVISLCEDYPSAVSLVVDATTTQEAADETLFEAVRQDDEALILEALKTTGANINAIGPGGQTPLMHAVLTGRDTAVKILLAHGGADTSIGEKDGYTPMHGAGFQGRAAIAKILLQHGLNPSDVHAGDGYTPIHRACWGRQPRHADTVQVLLEMGRVSPFEPSRDGKMPLDMTTNPATRKVLEDWIAKLVKTDEEDEGAEL